MASGLLAGVGAEAVASGITAVTLLLLVEKKQLHGVVSKIDRDEMRAGARFAVMAAVILPILPPGPDGPLGGIRPRQLWLFVLFFSGLSFLGYFARRTFGKNRGYAVAGTLGGLLSSTSVTLTFARLSQSAPEAGRALAAGTLGANVVLFPRVLIASTALAPALGLALWPSFVAPVVIGTYSLLPRIARCRPRRSPQERSEPAAVQERAADGGRISARPLRRELRPKFISASRGSWDRRC